MLTMDSFAGASLLSSLTHLHHFHHRFTRKVLIGMSSPAPSAVGAGSSVASSAAGSAGSATSAASASAAASAAPMKKCSQCAQQQLESLFSGAQLKKGGKRVCKGCVEEQQLLAEFTAAATVTWATATEQQRDAGRVLHAVWRTAQSYARQSALMCFNCIKSADYHKACDRCSSLVCSLDCFRKHRHTVCATMSNPPPLSIPEEDRITSAEIQTLWPQLQARLLQQASYSARSGVEVLHTFSADMFSVLTTLYPPTPRLCWWSNKFVIETLRFHFQNALAALSNLAVAANDILCATSTIHAGESNSHLPAGIVPLRAAPRSPLANHPSRFLHRLLLLARYILTHAPHLIQPNLRAYIDVQRGVRRDSVWAAPKGRRHARIRAGVRLRWSSAARPFLAPWLYRPVQ